MDPTELEMVGVSCEADHMYREATYILSPDTKSAPKIRKTPASYHATPSVHPNPDDFLTPVGSTKSISMKKCRFCGKEFRTTGALDTHLLIHRQEKLQTCDICHMVVKKHQLMFHMSTHKKTHSCTYSGCNKTYNNPNSLKHHCALRHGIHVTSSSFDHPTSRWEPVDTSAVSKQQLYDKNVRGLFNSPRKPVLPYVPKSSSNAEDIHLPQVKPSKRHPSWTLATARKYYDVKEREMLTGTLLAPMKSRTVEKRPLVISLSGSSFESGPDSPDSSSREMPSSVSSSNASEDLYSQQHYSIQMKHSLKPQNKLKRKRMSFLCNDAALSHPEPKSGSVCDFPEPEDSTPPSVPVIRTLSSAPLPQSRKRKYNTKDSETEVLTADPVPPLPEASHKRSRIQSPCQESTKRATGQEEYACKRTYTRRPAVRKTQLQTPCTRGRRGFCEKTEELTSQPTLRSQDEGQMQKSKRKNSTALIIPVLAPVTPTKTEECSQIRKGLSKRSCRLSSPLPTPERSPDQETLGRHGCCSTTGRPSQLRSPTYQTDHLARPRFQPPPYTPPPMLSPHRSRSGNYFNALLQQYPAAPASNYNPTHGAVPLPVDNTIVNIKPRINIGSRFQAEIPPLRNAFYELYEQHPAQLVWSPWKDLTNNNNTQKKVTELLDMCCSSVLTGGGTNIELALHCLHQVQGNIPAALDLLLMREDFRTFGHPLNDYHYTGSAHWTHQEISQFRKALEDHGKDFHKIHNVLQTKSVAQCVEYYYIMKNVKKFKQRVQGADEKDVEETTAIQDCQKIQPEQKKPKTRKRNTRRSNVQKRCFPCEKPPRHLNQDRDWLTPDHKDTKSRDFYGP